MTLAQGITPKLDVSVAPAMMWINRSGHANPHPGIYAVRGAVKFAPVRYVAISAGLAPGASAAGAYLTPDVGLTLAAENSYAVPFVTVRGFLSVPISPNRVRITTDDDADSAHHDNDSLPDTYYLTPRFTYGYQTSLGLKLPLVHDKAARVLPSAACALGVTGLYSGSTHSGYMGFGCAVDVVF